eukprot:Stramenopile-MAST_4_protein_3308
MLCCPSFVRGQVLLRDAFAAPVFNTAAVLIPVLPEEEWRTRKKPTLLYNHGTVAMDEEAPTSSRMCTGVGRSQGCSLTTSSVARASLWASVGYHVVLPDYEKLGLNASRGVHPYCQQQSYVRSTEDLLTALASIASLALSRRLIVAGYSEGGYASLAIHRGMELAKEKGAFTVIASFPQGGPLDWKYQVQHSILTYLNRENDAYWYIPYTIVAALEYNNFNRLYPTIFLPPYDTTLRTLYDRKTSVKTIESSIPKNGSDGVFLSGLRDAFLSHTLPNNIQALVVDQNNLLADTPEGTSWVPTAPILFCSGIDDEQVPVENTKRAHHALKARGAKVTLDLFPGDHVTNARNCLFALSRYLAVIDWETFGDTIPPISAQVRPNLLPVGVWYVLISVLAALVVQTSWSIVAMRSGGRCPTLFELWLNAFLAYPFVMLFVFLALNIGISLYGIAQSNWSINVDSDFANYLEADSELHFFEVSLATARKDSTFQKAVNERRLRHTDRRLRQERTQELKYWKLDLFYQRLDGTNIFSADSLNEIRTIERQLQAFQGYESFCHRTYDTIHTDGACTLPDSTVNIFFPTRVINGSRVEIEYNGKGVLTAIDHTLRAWARDGIFWYADRFFNARNLTSSYTRSQFRGGLPLHGHSTCCPGGTLDHEQKKKSDDFLRRLYDHFLIKINDGRTLVRVTWRESSVLTGYEVDQHLYFDALLSVGSLVFVYLFMFWYTTSAFLTTFAMLGILLSFPMAYFVFYVLVGIQKMMILNFVSLFLIMGIGADDVFVLFNAFEQSRAVLGTGASLQTRVKWAYEKAGAAMLITTTTTVGSFYANMFSTVRVIREFGLFMGTVTVFNFVNVMTLFPAAILVREKCRCSPRCQRQRRPPRPTASPSAIVPASGLRQVFSFQMENEEELHSIERMFRRRVSPCIQRYRYLSLCIACALTGIFGGLGALYFKTSTGPPVVFLEDINLGRVNAFVRATFGANTPEDLDRASVAFPKYKDVIQKGCPGLLPDGFTSCTGNGECNYDSLACECNEDFAGFACERSAETATISLPPNQNVVLDYYALDGGIYSKAIDFENRGDEDLVWTLTVAGTSTTLPSWISFTKGFPQVGIVKKLVQTTEGGARSFHKHSLAYDIIVGSETPGFKDCFFFKISNGDPRQDRTFTTDNTLSELNVNAQNYTMSPPFKPYILQYNLSVDASVSLINVNATTNASSAVVVINSIAGLTQIRLDYALAPLMTTVTIHVRAENGEVLIYQIHVYRIPRPCTPVCGDRGSCNGFVGECICNTEDGYSGAAQGCQTYCPGNCYGHGTCDASLKLCNCESTYTGGGCMSRTCPICANGGVCDRLSWSCTCPEGWRGELCTHVTCPNDCSSLGECLNSGICKCLPGYTGKDCSTKIEIKIPLEYTIEVQLVFGLRGYNTKNKSRPVYDPNFDLSQPASQRFLLAACQNARNISSLKVRPELRCWIETFNDEVTKTGYTFPLSSGLFSPAIDTFFDNERALQAYGDDIGTQGSSDSIKWTSLRLRVNVDKTLGYLLLQDIHQKWIGYTQLLSKETPIFLGPATLVSETFTKMDTEVGIIQSTILSFIISNAICFLCIVLFTQDWQISLFSLLTINFIVITLLGFLFSIMQYTFGAIEAVGVTIFVGMSKAVSIPASNRL